jgi:hypothetical protein
MRSEPLWFTVILVAGTFFSSESHPMIAQDADVRALARQAEGLSLDF